RRPASVLTAAEPAEIVRWDVSPASWVLLACHVSNRELSTPRSEWRQMSAPSPTTDLSIGARLTGYLRERFTWRTSTEARPRYLGIFAMPTPDYMGAAAPLPSVPRFGVTVGSSQFDSDLPDEFLAPATPDGGDGSI